MKVIKKVIRKKPPHKNKLGKPFSVTKEINDRILIQGLGWQFSKDFKEIEED